MGYVWLIISNIRLRNCLSKKMMPEKKMFTAKEIFGELKKN